MNIGAESPWGPTLCGVGLLAILAGVVVYGFGGRPTLLTDTLDDERPPVFWERMSVHLVFYAVWALGFGANLWRGAPKDPIDVRFSFERDWPVLQVAEWIYVSVYFVPFFMPWLKTTRGNLRRYAFNLWWLLLFSLLLFLVFPVGSPPRTFRADSLAGTILRWETDRADFAAASLPSFHLFWACLCADFLAPRGPVWRLIGWSWAAAVAVACVANGAHALLDIAAAVVLYPLVTRPGAWGRHCRARVEAVLSRAGMFRLPGFSSRRIAGRK
jgi:hypothetical protein